MPFDLAKFQEELATQAQLSEQRRQEAILAQKTQAKIRDEAVRNADKYVQDTRFMADTIQQNLQARNRERGLEDSMNPFDSIKLLGLRTLAPERYTKQGRSQRLAEDSQIAAAIGQVYGIESQRLESMLQASTAAYDRAKLFETLGYERLKQKQEQMELMKGEFEANQTLQNITISSMTPDEITKAIGAAGVNRTANINGVEVDIMKLQDRAHALKEREHTMAMQEYVRRLEQVDLINVDTAIASRQLASDVAREEIENKDIAAAKRQAMREDDAAYAANAPTRRAKEEYDAKVVAEANATYEQQAQVRALANQEEFRKRIDELNARLTDTFNLEELREIRQNKYIYNGVALEPQRVESAIELRQRAQAEGIENQFREYQMKNFDLTRITQEGKRLEVIKNRFAVGSPARNALEDYEKALGTTSFLAGAENPIENRAVGIAIYEQAKATFAKAIENQAEAESKGNKAIKELLTAWYSDQPLPQETIIEEARTRLTKNKPLVGLLPQNIAMTVETAYRQEVEQFMKTNGAQDMGGGLLSLLGGTKTTSLAEVRAEAAVKALAFGIKEHTQQETDKIFGSQVEMPGHPLYGQWNRGQMLGLNERADAEAKQQWMDELQISEAEANAILKGTPYPADAVTSPDDRQAVMQRLRLAENHRLFFHLEALKPGLSQEFAQWWQEQGVALAQQLGQSRNPVNMQQAAVDTFLDDSAVNAAQAYAIGLAESHDTMRREHAARVFDQITYRSDPIVQQAMFLELDTNLSSRDKQRAMRDIIIPLVGKAKERGLNFKQTAEFVENNLMSFESADPENKKLVKTLLRDRSQILDQIKARDEMTRNIFSLDETYLSQQKPAHWFDELMSEIRGGK